MKYKLAFQALIVLVCAINSSLIFAQTTIHTFSKAHVGFGNGLTQEAFGDFVFPSDTSNIRKINMIIKLECPFDNCGAWDVFASISVKHSGTNSWYEMGRYITPYGVDNHARGRGFVIDVTDFKSLLKGNVKLRSFTEVWTTSGWLVSVDFDLLRGTPDYPYTALAPAIHYAKHSQDLPYGKSLRAGQTLKSKISIPSNTEETKMRTTISGWGHASPGICAEWCVKTHTIAINNINTLSHRLNAIGCASNPVNNQRGNWRPDRAGWCPGMEVPIRNNTMGRTYAGQTFTYEHKFQPYRTTDEAYYAVTSFVVIKSNTPINPPTVTPIYTTIALPSYCSLKGNSTRYEWIKGIKVGNFSKASGNNTGYGDFSNETINLSPGNNTVTLTPGSAGNYNEYWRVWIDFNQNNQFETTEKIFENNSVSTLNGTITVPSSAKSGNTRMRIAMRYNALPTSPCGSLDNGEVEDYTVKIHATN